MTFRFDAKHPLRGSSWAHTPATVATPATDANFSNGNAGEEPRLKCRKGCDTLRIGTKQPPLEVSQPSQVVGMGPPFGTCPVCRTVATVASPLAS